MKLPIVFEATQQSVYITSVRLIHNLLENLIEKAEVVNVSKYLETKNSFQITQLRHNDVEHI